MRFGSFFRGGLVALTLGLGIAACSNSSPSSDLRIKPNYTRAESVDFPRRNDDILPSPAVPPAENSSSTPVKIPLTREQYALIGENSNCRRSDEGLEMVCEETKPLRESFFFDNSRFTLGNYRGGDSPAMDEFVGGDGRITFKTLLGYENFVFGFGAEHQSIMQSLQAGGSDGWGASMLGVSYHINMDLRWYIDFFGRNNAFFGIGNDHISDRLIDGDVEYEQFLAEHPEITINSPVIDVVSYQVGGKFKVSDRVSPEGRVGYNAYQTTPPYTISALWDKDKRGENYPYGGFIELKVPFEFADRWRVYGQVQSEFNSKKAPTNWRWGVEKGFDPYPFGIRFYAGTNVGRDGSSLEKTRFGIEGNERLVKMFEVYASF